MTKEFTKAKQEIEMYMIRLAHAEPYEREINPKFVENQLKIMEMEARTMVHEAHRQGYIEGANDE